MEVGASDGAAEQRIARNEHGRTCWIGTELRIEEEADAALGVPRRENHLPRHVPDLDDIAIAYRVVDRARLEAHVIVRQLRPARDDGRIDSGSDDDGPGLVAQFLGGSHVVGVAVRQNDGIEFAIAERVEYLVSLARGIHHEGGLIIRDDEHVVCDHAEHEILDRHAGALYLVNPSHRRLLPSRSTLYVVVARDASATTLISSCRCLL